MKKNANRLEVQLEMVENNIAAYKQLLREGQQVWRGHNVRELHDRAIKQADELTQKIREAQDELERGTKNPA